MMATTLEPSFGFSMMATLEPRTRKAATDKRDLCNFRPPGGLVVEWDLEVSPAITTSHHDHQVLDRHKSVFVPPSLPLSISYTSQSMPDEGVLKPITRANPPRHRRDEARQHASTVDHLRLPSVAISSGAKRSLGTEPLSRAEPEVRINLPPAGSLRAFGP